MDHTQTFKAVYFKDYKVFNPSSKALTLAFGKKDQQVFTAVRDLNSSALRDRIGFDSYKSLKDAAEKEGFSINTFCLWQLRKNDIEEPRKIEKIFYSESISQLLNRVIRGDCLEVMNKIPNKSIDMVLCDLPYGTTQNKWDSIISLDQLWKHYERIIKDNGIIILTAQGLFTAQLMLSNQKLFKYKIVWVKSKSTNFLNVKKQPLRKHEDILIFYKNQPAYTPQMSKGEAYNKGFRKNQLTGSYGDFKTVEVKSNGERYPTDVVYIKTAESEGPVYHPTQKPVELGRYLIKTFAKQEAIVLDNAAGSGSFLVSAVLEGRNYIGIEKNQEVYLFKKKQVDYIKICRQRIKQAQEDYKREQAELRLF